MWENAGKREFWQIFGCWFWIFILFFGLKPVNLHMRPKKGRHRHKEWLNKVKNWNYDISLVDNIFLHYKFSENICLWLQFNNISLIMHSFEYIRHFIYRHLNIRISQVQVCLQNFFWILSCLSCGAFTLLGIMGKTFSLRRKVLERYLMTLLWFYFLSTTGARFWFQSCPVGDVWFTSDVHEHGGTWTFFSI